MMHFTSLPNFLFFLSSRVACTDGQREDVVVLAPLLIRYTLFHLQVPPKHRKRSSLVNEHNHRLVESCGENKHLFSHKSIDAAVKDTIRHLRKKNVELTKVNCILRSMRGSAESVPFTKNSIEDCVCWDCTRQSTRRRPEDNGIIPAYIKDWPWLHVFYATRWRQQDQVFDVV